MVKSSSKYLHKAFKWGIFVSVAFPKTWKELADPTVAFYFQSRFKDTSPQRQAAL
jgi:hypothetical protein